MLHIDFKEADGHTKDGLIRILFDVVEDMLYGARNYTELVLSSIFILVVTATH